MNVGRAQLRWLERATSFIVGTGAGRQTSEATAIGVSAAIFATLEALQIPADRLRRPLGNVEVALFGLGKSASPCCAWSTTKARRSTSGNRGFATAAKPISSGP